MSEEAIMAMVCLGLPILAGIVLAVASVWEESNRLAALVTVTQFAMACALAEDETRNPDEAASSRKVGHGDGGEIPPHRGEAK